MTNWKPEQDEDEEQPVAKPSRELDYKVEAIVVLEDSDKNSWGMAKQKDSSFSLEPGELVGQWSRSPTDGLIYVFLNTPLAAMANKATLKFAEYAEKRRVDAATPKAKARGTRASAPKSKAEPVPSEELNKISDLRKLFKH